MKRLVTFILLALMLASAPAYAKLSQFILRGWIERQDYSKTDWNREGVDSVFVALVKNDTIPVDFKMLRGDNDLKMTGEMGDLRMMVYDGVGSYSLILNREGYEPLRKDFKIASESQDVMYLRSLIMEPRRQNELKELEVVGTAIKMVMKGDTIVYDSRAFQLADGASLEALVRQLPGAELDDDGSIKVHGKKVNSLLLNGQDFFKGDPDVILKNLPAYTVDKIKVYDKAGKDDAVTLASHRLTDSPEDENLVMDVMLKKEFSMATIFNIEGGYGPGIYTSDDPRKFDNRYLGRTFIVGFGKTYRFSVFGNANNIKNTSRSSSGNKDWSGGWGQSGELDVIMGGFDVFFNPNENIEASADLQYSNEQVTLRQLTSSTHFYETGNLYSRTRTEQDDRRHHIIANANFMHRGDHHYFNITPKVDWFRSRGTGYSYDVNLNDQPDERKRGALIDSLFRLSGTPGLSSEQIRKITSYNYRSYRGHASMGGHPDWLNMSLYTNARFMPANVRGSMGVYASVNDRNSKSNSGQIFDQTTLSAATDPIRYTQWTDNSNRNTDAQAEASYQWSKRFMNGEVFAHNLAIGASAGWSMERQKQQNVLRRDALMAGFDPSERLLPSQYAPTGADYDPQNTLNTLFLNNRATGRVDISYSREILAPSDSGVNLSYHAWAGLTETGHFRSLHYSKALLDPPFIYHTSTTDRTDAVNGGFGLSSNNKARHHTVNLYYSYSNSLVNLFTLLPTTNSTDPFNIYLGPADGIKLRTPSSHYLQVYYYSYYTKSQINLYGNVSSNIYRNSTAQTTTFDPSTGVYTHRPVNVNGNWSLSGWVSATIPFGPEKRWNADASLNYNHDNSVDYVSVMTAPVRSHVRTNSVEGSLNISYRLKGGTKFSLGGSSGWDHSTSPRQGFQTISATDSKLRAAIDFYLPWQIQGETNLTAQFRRGYQDQSLNTTEWIWNLSVQKSILDGNLTFKINAVDLLGQLSAISYIVNAQGRAEVWTNNLPRYAMLTISYRFTHTPKALKN